MAIDQRSLQRHFKAFGKQLLKLIPFVRRGRHERIVARMQEKLRYERAINESMGLLFLTPPPLASATPCEHRVAVSKEATDELCLFVTHVDGPDLKPHVVDHIDALLRADVAVLLIANTDLEPAKLRIPPDLAARLHGCVIRKNVGFDFAAWAQGYCLLERGTVRRRLYLVNDSILGPLDLAAYASLLQRIRESTADVIGLTANPDPHEHLQSFFLIFNERLLRSETCDEFMRGVVNMPQKQNVIDCYELWLTRFLEQRGFQVAAIFPKISQQLPPMRNDTLHSWTELLDIGFPFIKAAVLKDPIRGKRAWRRVPARYKAS